MEENTNLSAAFCVSIPWNIFHSVESLEKPGLNKHLLNRTLAKGLVENVVK